MKHMPKNRLFKLILAPALSFMLFACSNSVNEGDTGSTHSVSAATLIAGSVALTGNSVVKNTVAVTTNTLYFSNIGMVRFNDPWGSKEITVDLGSYTAGDLGGVNASLSLVAETQNYPINGGAYPVITSFYVQPSGGGSTIEYVNLTAACKTSGMWVCTSGYCSANPSCTVTSGASGFAGRSDWDQHQVPPYGYSTTNTFPRCDGNIAGWGGSNCGTGNGGLVAGHYFAKYILLSDSGSSVASRTANLQITAYLKNDTQGRDAAATNGGVNINVILVGDKNVQDSHTPAGAKNLTLLFKEVNRLFSATGAGKFGINQIKTYEWTDANGGDQYSEVDYSNLGDLFQAGSKGVDSADNGKNINIFLVSDIEYTGANFTILGLSGAILGPPLNGTQTSGLAFSSFNKLATYNSDCADATCDRTVQQSDFLEMAATIVHEMGHYLGLNHPSEKPDTDGDQTHDGLTDTPTCAARSSSSWVLDQRACYYTDTTVQPSPLGAQTCASACDTITGGTHYMTASTSGNTLIDPWTTYYNSDMPTKFCPAAKECQFNHVMWYTTKNRHLQKTSDGSTCQRGNATAGQCTWSEDGNLFSLQSQAIIQWNPFVR